MDGHVFSVYSHSGSHRESGLARAKSGEKEVPTILGGLS